MINEDTGWIDLDKWEGLINKFAKKWKFLDRNDEHYEDVIKNELRITYYRANKRFDPNKGVKKITYVYKAFHNRCVDLYKKSLKREEIRKSLFLPNSNPKDFQSKENDDSTTQKIFTTQILDNNYPFNENLIFSDLFRKKLSRLEREILDLNISGYKFSEIRKKKKISEKDLRDIRKGLQKKIDKNDLLPNNLFVKSVELYPGKK
tara:strand:+ start:2609 stop:3223 length:615 start_codon:yes stop_codon:yes gene_type:complete